MVYEVSPSDWIGIGSLCLGIISAVTIATSAYNRSKFADRSTAEGTATKLENLHISYGKLEVDVMTLDAQYKSISHDINRNYVRSDTIRERISDAIDPLKVEIRTIKEQYIEQRVMISDIAKDMHSLSNSMASLTVAVEQAIHKPH